MFVSPRKPNANFPRYLFRWFLSKQILLSSVGLLILAVAHLIWLQGSVLSEQVLTEARWIVMISLFCSAGVVIMVSLLMARQLMVPLGRLIEKTRRLHHFPFQEENETTEELGYDEPGEWYDLERALNELGEDLKNKTIRLSREKTELRTIMSALSEGVLAVSRERRPLFYNQQFAMMFRLDGDWAKRAQFGEITRSPDVLAAYEGCLKDGAVRNVEAQFDLPNLGVRVFRVSIAPLRKKHNQEIYGAVAVFHDVTTMKQAEKMRVEFVGNVSHELRTPLTSIKGYMQTLIQDVEQGRTEDLAPFLHIVDRNVNRLMGLVGDLLDLSALQSGVELKRSRIDLEALTQSVFSQVDVRCHRMEQAIEVETLLADESKVEQVLRNLLQNAIRYVPPGGQVKVSWALDDKGQVALRVKDNGPGIAKEHQGRLFERFYRIDEARNRQVGGSGIGLALVKHIMLRHGGQVKVVSEPGRGAEFICEFPN